MMACRIDNNGVLLADLLAGIGDVADFGRLVVQGVSLDSRDIRPGDLFLALPGTRGHGMQYFEKAVQAGASAVLAEPDAAWGRARLSELAATARVPVFKIFDLRAKAGVIAARFFGQPSLQHRVIGVTGTNGKTSVACFLAQALAARVKTGMMGTLGNGLYGALLPSQHTTPDAVAVQAELSRQQTLGVRATCMEVSSHALDQGRVAGVHFHTAVFTNLTRDHLDYHGSMQAYAEAKAKLFQRQGLALAVINTDDSVGHRLASEIMLSTRVVGCSARGVRPHTDRYVRALEIKPLSAGLAIQLDTSWGAGQIETSLLGRFNVENVLLTLGVLLGWDMPLDTAIAAVQALQSVDGRMQGFGGGLKPRVIVDYAHTPDALEQALSSLREHAQARLVCLFGCGGERDRGKRPLMGEVAARLADKVVLTDDNPRGENGASIIEDVRRGIPKHPEVVVQRDRSQAIREAISEANSQDIILVAGKGHESCQWVGDQKLPFSDREQVLKALEEYLR